MKKIICAAAAALVLSCFSCQRHPYQIATVVKDCTGTYLRLYQKDYHVCNPEKVEAFANGVTITASFDRIITCNGSAKDDIVCMMMHENEGWINVKGIR
ncbi:MAG: hypothetical protein V4615_13765 [Bacteroidota bacterium]